MISISDLKRILAMEQEIVEEQTRDLTQADTLIQPQPGGNCMNWVLGHLLDNQVLMLETLGGVSPIEKKGLERYARGSEPVLVAGPDVLEFEFLLTGHGKVNQAIQQKLDEMTEPDFSRDVEMWDRKVLLGWRIFFLQFHYTYHVGQLEPLRNLAGRTEKII